MSFSTRIPVRNEVPRSLCRTGNPDGITLALGEVGSDAQRAKSTELEGSMPDGQKRCSKCIELKPVDEFHRKTKGSGDRVARCKKCQNAERRARKASRRAKK